MSDSSMDEGDLFPQQDESDEDEQPRKRRRTTKILRGRGVGFVKADEDEDEEDNQRPSFNIGEYNEDFNASTTAEDPPSPPKPQVLRPSFFNSGGRAFGNSFAAKMMAKMGYKEGQGLGASGQGIVNPIEAKRLSKGTGLGVGGSSEETVKRRTEKKLEKPKMNTPRARAPPRQKFQTVAEIEARGLAVPASLKSIIIDATGPETRTLSSTNGLMTPTRSGSPEIEAAKIAKRAKRDLDAFADAWNAEEDSKERIEEEKARCIEEIDRQEVALRRLRGVVQTLEVLSIENMNSGAEDDLDSQWEAMIAKLVGLQDFYADELDDYGLFEASVALLEPLFKRQMMHWEPLIKPEHLTSSLASIQAILGVEHIPANRRRRQYTCYETMIVQHWFPKVRDFLNRQWDIHDAESAIALIESWQTVLPTWIQTKVMHDVVVPRLKSAIRSWHSSRSSKSNAKNGTQQPMYAWVPQWLPHLDEQDLDSKQPDSLLGMVKHKLDVDEWRYWKNVFGEKAKADVASVPTTPENDLSARPSTTHFVEMTFREQVEQWCDEEELLFTSLHRPNPSGLPLYRLHSADGKGVVVSLQNDVVWSESGDPYALDDTLATVARSR